MPVASIARAAVDATRRRKPDVIHPGWYGIIAYYRLLAPELLDPLLRTFINGQPYDSPAKSIQDAIGGGLAEPTEGQLRAGGMREPRRKASVEPVRPVSYFVGSESVADEKLGRSLSAPRGVLDDSMDHVLRMAVKHLTRRLNFF